MKLIAFSGSLRKDSLNKRLAQEALRLASQDIQAEVEYIDLQPLNIPLYDGDIESSSGIPDGIKLLAEKIKGAHGIVISTPEYNHSISSALKNTVDWLSRMKPMELKGKHILFLTTSPGQYGGARAMYSNRTPFEAIGAHVYPTMFTLPGGGDAFDDKGQLKDEKTRNHLSGLLRDYSGFASRK